jgi:glycosyltransferase involved in cell wall biosynthesis
MPANQPRDSRPPTAWVYLCKAKPLKAGGGLGVAYNHLDAIHGRAAQEPGVDSYLLCGCQLTELPCEAGRSFDAFVEALEPGMKPGFSMFFQQALMIRQLAKRYRRVVVLSFTPFYFWPLAKAGLNDRVVCIHSEHSKGGRHFELAEERGRFGIKEWMVRAAVWVNFLSADHAVFPSAGSVALFQEMNPHLAARVGRMAKVVHNGVEPVTLPEDAGCTGGSSLRIVSIAHHVREKGLNAVLQTLASPAVKDLPWTFVNYGSHSAMTPELQSRARTLEIAGRVEFAGLKPQAEVRQALIAASAFLHLPVIVVFDLSLLEAMMCGVPVITNRLPGNVEALGEDYPLYAADASEAAVRLHWLAEHPADACKIGKDLRERAATHFTKTAMAGRYLQLLHQVSIPLHS